MNCSLLMCCTGLVIMFVVCEFIIGYKCYFNKEKRYLRWGMFNSNKSIEDISEEKIKSIGKYHVLIGIFFGTLIENSLILIFLNSCCSNFYLASKFGTFIMDIYYLDFILFIYIIASVDTLNKSIKGNKGQIK